VRLEPRHVAVVEELSEGRAGSAVVFPRTSLATSTGTEHVVGFAGATDTRSRVAATPKEVQFGR